MAVYRQASILSTKSDNLIEFRKCLMRDQFVTYYGRILTIGVDGGSLQEVQATVLVKIFQNSLIMQMVLRELLALIS